MKYWMGLFFVGLSAFSAWAMWGPVLGFLLSVIPATAEYAWVGKLIVIGLVGYFGGIGMPVCFLCLAAMFFIGNFDD